MAHVRIRVTNRSTTEELPWLCLYCGTPVTEQRRGLVPIGGEAVALMLPLCEKHHKYRLPEVVAAQIRAGQKA